MRILKWILGLIALLAVVFVAGAYLLPRNVEVARSIEINATADDVFPHVNALQAAENWSPWLGRDPEVQLTYSGPEAGVGNKLEWMSEHPQVGNGTQEIIGSEPGKSVTSALDFGPMGQATARFDLAEASGVTTVTWGFQSDMGMNPMGRWMGLMMDSWVGGDYEAGLANLKALVEG
ncbi:MAG: SRPBCC family protein [Pseudomonadota bacterium]